MHLDTDLQIDPLVFQKAQTPILSGYLPAHLQTPRDFPSLPQHHFRIQNDHTFLQLQTLYRQSKPSDLSYGSEAYQSRMRQLMQVIDAIPGRIQCGQAETHGYYEMGEVEDMEEEVMRGVREEEERRKMVGEFRQMTIRPRFREKAGIEKKTKALVAKMNKLEINEY